MIDALPAMIQPDWLSNIVDKELSGPFPLEYVLQSSLYYPASGFDGDPVAYMAGNIFSFVYVNYGRSRDALNNELRERNFLGYSLMGRRGVSKQELIPNGWTPVPPRPGDGDPAQYRDWIQEPFCDWLIFERDAGRGKDHGPNRFSLLYLCADGVAAFQALYVRNRLRPLGIAIIQPGHGLGGNWTNFTDEQAPLARAVLGNPAGEPDVLLYGGAGGPDSYTAPCWRKYSEGLGFLGNTSIGVWRRPPDLEQEHQIRPLGQNGKNVLIRSAEKN